MRGPAPLAWVLHGVTDGGRRRRRAEVLLRRRCRRRHHVVGVRHHGRLARVVAGVVVWWLAARVGRVPGGRVVLDGHSDEVAVLARGHCGDSESLGAEGGARRWTVVRARRRPAVGVMGRVRMLVWVWVWVGAPQVHVVLCHVGLRHTEAVGRHVGHRRQVQGFGPRGRRRLRRPHVAVVDMRLQVALRQVRALAAWHHAAHVEGATVALLDALHRVGAAVQVEAGRHRKQTLKTSAVHQDNQAVESTVPRPNFTRIMLNLKRRIRPLFKHNTHLHCW